MNFIPGCYDQNGNPVPVPPNPNQIFYPWYPEGRWQPSPQQAAINVAKAIATIPAPQPGLL